MRLEANSVELGAVRFIITRHACAESGGGLGEVGGLGYLHFPRYRICLLSERFGACPKMFGLRARKRDDKNADASEN